MSTLVGMTKHNFYSLNSYKVFFFFLFFFFFSERLLFNINIPFVRLQDNTSFEKDGFHI